MKSMRSAADDLSACLRFCAFVDCILVVFCSTASLSLKSCVAVATTNSNAKFQPTKGKQTKNRGESKTLFDRTHTTPLKPCPSCQGKICKEGCCRCLHR